MVEADGAERAAARGEPFDDDVARTLEARLDGARDQPGQWAEGPHYAALAAAELTRLEHALGRGEPDPDAWLDAAAGFEDARPAVAGRVRAPARRRGVRGRRRPRAAAAPLIAARAAAEAMEAAPLVDAADALARRARVRVDASSPAPSPRRAPRSA